MHFTTALPLSVALAALPFLTGSNAQSSSSSGGGGGGGGSQSQAQSQTQSGSSAMPSASGSPGAGGPSNGFVSDYVAFLDSAGYTSLSSAIQQANQTQSGQSWLTELSDGSWTVFAPTNQAFSSVPQNVSSDPNTLAEYLSYHYVYGDLHNTTSAAAGGGGGGGGCSAGSGGGTCTNSATGTGAGGGGSGSMTGSMTGTPTGTGTGGGNGNGGSATPSAMGLHHWLSRQQGGQGGQGGQSSGIQLDSNTYPNDTIGRTLLSSPQFVRLEGDKNQVLAWTRMSPGGNVTILNQMTGNNQNVTVGNGTQWRNLAVFEVDGVFLPPGNASQALTAVGDTPAVTFANQVQVPGENGSNTTALQVLEQGHGFTAFAPASEAFTSQVNQTLQGLQQSDPSQLLHLARNHYINGSTVYSPTLLQLAANSSSSRGSDNGPHLTSGAGQYFTFSSNSSGLFVSVGNDTSARVVRPDILVENGVIHLVDSVLYRTDNNDDVASSAYASASEAATESATDTQAIIYPATTASGAVTSSQQQSSTQSSQQQASSTATGSATGSTAAATPSSFRIRRALHV